MAEFIRREFLVDAECVGKRVRIHEIKMMGSAWILNGLTGTVIGPHPLTQDWVKIRLDPNCVTFHEEWSIPKDRLVYL